MIPLFLYDLSPKLALQKLGCDHQCLYLRSRLHSLRDDTDAFYEEEPASFPLVAMAQAADLLDVLIMLTGNDRVLLSRICVKLL